MRRYAIGVVAVAIAVVIRLLLAPFVGDESLYLFLIPAVMAAAGSVDLAPGSSRLRSVCCAGYSYCRSTLVSRPATS